MADPRHIVVMFQQRFSGRVRNGSKRHTIRGERKVPVAPGDILDLREWSGLPYRSKQQPILKAPCTTIQGIEISACHQVWLDGVELTPIQIVRLALGDGFTGGLDMIAWFAETHGLPFKGVLISW